MALRLMIREAAAEAGQVKTTATTPAAAPTADTSPTQLPQRFETIPTDVQQKQFIRPIIDRINVLNPNVSWTEGVEDEAIKYFKILKNEYNNKQGKIGDIKSFIEKLITKPIEKAAPEADKEKSAKAGKKKTAEKATEQPAEKPAKQKFVSPLRSHLQKEFPEVKFTAAQVNFINKLLKPYGFFTLTEAFDKSKIVNKIVKAILVSDLFANIKEDYGLKEFKTKLESMFGALGGLTPAEKKATEKPEPTPTPDTTAASETSIAAKSTSEEPQVDQPEKQTASQTKEEPIETVADEDIKELVFQKYFDEVKQSEKMNPAEKKLAERSLEKIKTQVNVSDLDPVTGRYTGKTLEPKQISSSIQQAAQEIGTQVKQNVAEKVAEYIASKLKNLGFIGEKEANEILSEIKKSNKTVIYEGLFDKFLDKKHETPTAPLFRISGKKIILND